MPFCKKKPRAWIIWVGGINLASETRLTFVHEQKNDFVLNLRIFLLLHLLRCNKKMNYNILWLKEEVWGDLFISVYCTSLSLSLSLSLFPCLRIGQRCTHTRTHTWAPLTRFFSSSHTHTHTQTSFSHHTSFSSLLLSVTLTWSQKCFHLLSLTHTHTQHTQIQALSLKHALTRTFFYLLCCGLRQRRLNRSDNNLVQIKK